VKIIGLGVEAAMYGAYAENPAVADTQGLGRLLYAALTAHWPGPDSSWPTADTSFLPPAPVIDGELCSPRQVRAGVPSGIDVVTTQAIAGRPYRGRPPLASPAALAEALAQVAPTARPAPPPLPVARARPAPTTPGAPGRAAPTMRVAASTGQTPAPRGPRSARGVMFGAIIVLGIAAVALGAWALSHSLGKSAHAGSAPPVGHSSAALAPLVPQSAHGFDVYDLNPQDGNENDKFAPRAIDADPATYWYTDFYLNNPVFGGLKPGTGLILDMGKPVKLADVTVTFGATAGADVTIEVGNGNTMSPATLATFTPVAHASDVPGGAYTFKATSSATGRYVLIWFTKLPHEPRGPANHYEAEVFNVAVRGTS
jgi:hypothetical protein